MVMEDDRHMINVEALENTMRAKLRGNSPWGPSSCIFKVPEVLRRHNPKAYQPDVVSIGPFHRGNKQFEHMENVKQWYLNNLLLRMEMSLEILIQGIVNHENEKCSRDFYADALDDLKPSDFIEMMILDGCFIIELFRKFMYKEHRSITDPIFNMGCMFQYICHDLLLLENQLPWSVLECLFSLTQDNQDPDPPSLRKIMLTVFTSQAPLAHNCISYLEYLEAQGRDNNDDDDDYGYDYNSDYNVDNDDTDDNEDDHILHILDLMRTSIVFPFKDFDQSFFKYSTSQLMHPATALSEAGVKFKSDTDAKSIMNIEFKDGVFTIPQLAVGELTEPLFRNLIAFEQCYHGRSHKITSYAVLMDNLIDSNKDMEFLCGKKIIGNWLSAEDGSKFFNKLYNDTLLVKFYYRGLCAQLNDHYDVKWKTWLERLKRDKFSDPWKFTSLFVALVFLVLTSLQTAYTIRK